MAFNGMDVFLALDDIQESLEIFIAVLLSSLEAPTSSNWYKQLNLVLLGKTGGGKSATGNTTLGRRVFESSSSVNSVTSEVTSRKGVCGNYVINIVDTPGLADTNFLNDKLKAAEKTMEHMEKALRLSPDGVHAFLFVLQFGNRFTEEDRRALDTLRQIFGRSFLERHGIILFTHGDCFEPSMDNEDTPNKSFEEWYKEQKGIMGDLIKECDNRCILFNNRLRDGHAMKKQVEKLVGLVERCESSYTFEDFAMFQSLRDRLIIELKLPKLKQIFQRDINHIKSVINLKDQCGRMSPAGVHQIKLQIYRLVEKIIMEDKETNLLSDMLAEITAIDLQFDSYLKKQEEARRRSEEDNSLCSIM